VQKHTRLLSEYKSLIDLLGSRYVVTFDEQFSDLVNFQTNQEIPRHRWFGYKQGYSAKLVERVLKDTCPSKDHCVLDPFAGVGTTNLVAQNFHYQNVGFDINPVASFAAEVKLSHFTENEKTELSGILAHFTPRLTETVPKSTLLENSFSRRMFDHLMHIKGFYESCENERIRSLLKLAYLSIVEVCSNRIKDGNGIKIVRNKQEILDAYSYYLSRCRLMLRDIEQSNSPVTSRIVNGSILLEKDFAAVKDKDIGIVVFSPPYANCFDYCEVYKLELWMGDFVSSYRDFDKFRLMALRSHVNSQFDHAIKNPNHSVDVISDIISCFNIWNRNIPDMIRGYFDDMTELFKKLERIMVHNSKCFIVVANSAYKGIVVPTDLLLADLAQAQGFMVKKMICARNIRASSQYMSTEDEHKSLSRESIIVIEKT